VMTSAQSIDMTTANISTDVDIRDGQKIVVGKANVTSAQDAVIVVVTAKLVN
jgi:urease alpha subunit